MKRINARTPVSNFGFWMLGPALLKFGSEELKREHLPPICRGEIRWCQGYSEPNAGSDLASLQTRAEDKGDHFVVNGQKIWTSYADKADCMFCLVRTDPDARKQAGISFLLLDMESEGVSTRPIQLISGESPFCETFFDDVSVPQENLVGGSTRAGRSPSICSPTSARTSAANRRGCSRGAISARWHWPRSAPTPRAASTSHRCATTSPAWRSTPWPFAPWSTTCAPGPRPARASARARQC